MIRPLTPAAWAVLIAWASNRPAPVAEAVLPLRSRARAMSGAAVGVLIVANCTLSPRAPV